jgi:hypothetical protein
MHRYTAPDISRLRALFIPAFSDIPLQNFITPVCVLAGSRLDSCVPGTSVYAAILMLDSVAAEIMCTDMRAFLIAAYGRIDGRRAKIPLYDHLDGQWVLDLYATTVPTICDREGYACVAARLPPGSRVRVQGHYAPFKACADVMVMMDAIQIIQAAETRPRLFEAA